MNKLGKIIKNIILIIVVFAVIVVGLFAYLNYRIVKSESSNIVHEVTGKDASDYIIDKEDKEKIEEISPQCIMVLGCGIKDYNTPTPMLKDRLDTGIALYKQGIAPKLMLTGDNGTITHNEIHVMLQYALKAGIPPKDIFCDHAGFSTYDSVYRGKSIFQINSMVVVTQKYHLYRSLHIAEGMGIKVKGVASEQKIYEGQSARDFREVLARGKDFFKTKIKSRSLLGGETISITGDGRISHGE